MGGQGGRHKHVRSRLAGAHKAMLGARLTSRRTSFRSQLRAGVAQG